MIKRVDRKFVLIAFAAISAIALLFVLCSCNGELNDQSYKTEDYIEVKSLRIADGSSNIYMSSSGDPSSRQLNIVTVPTDATNKKLSYYIPSDYHGFLTVSETGLLTAHKVSDGEGIPVTVKSTTNSKATLSLRVYIEDVEVRRVGFAQESLELLYNGKSATVTPVYTPSHAIDGRNAVFSSNDESVCLVSAEGTVTPVGVGYTRVIATCTTRTGKTITDYLEVHVSYATGDYQLEVSGNPSFNQVIGNYTPINFTLLILGENVDPEPEISWYIGDTARVDSNEDLLQYTHVPTATTEISYYIKVIVRPHQGNPVVLKSDTVSCHNAFTGIDLTYDNLSSVYKSYRYGDEVTFDISAGDSSATIASYEWYLSFATVTKNEICVATTTLTDKNLTRRINVTGDYSLIAKGLDANGNLVTQQKFTFSAEKYAVGDTLVVTPSPSAYGLPPDSYHWYVVPCDEDGNYDASEKTLYTDTQNGKKLVMPLRKSGTFRLLVTAAINGVTATTTVNGEEKPYELVSDVIRVYGDDYRYAYSEEESLLPSSDESDVDRLSDKDYSLVDNVTVEGIGRTTWSDYLVFVKWDNYGPVPSFVIEITKSDGEVVFIDSASSSSSLFGSNYCYISSDVVSLRDVFGVRVKQKNGSFSQKVNYGSLNEQGTTDKTHVSKFATTLYPFFDVIGYNNASKVYTSAEASIMDAPAINGYMSDMNDVIAYLSFISTFRPTSNTYVTQSTVQLDSVGYNAYTADIYIPFAYADRYETLYPHGLSEEELSSYAEYASLAKIFYGAAASLPYLSEFRIQFTESPKGEGVRVAILFPIGESTIKSTSSTKVDGTQSLHYEYNASETVDTSGLPVNLLDKVTVSTSDQLVETLVRGYQPVPGDESLTTLYKIMLSEVVRITSAEMTDKEKAIAFYDYIALSTSIASSSLFTDENKYRYVEFRVESVFTGNRASTDVGIAKAYAALCRIAGITCVTATAYTFGSTHTFNKVLLDGSWYIADVSGGMAISNGSPVVNYDYLLISDERFIELYTEGKESAYIYGETPSATKNEHCSERFACNPDEKSLADFFASCRTRRVGNYCVEIDFYKSERVDTDAVRSYLSSLSFDGIKINPDIYVIEEDASDIRAIVIFNVLGE